VPRAAPPPTRPPRGPSDSPCWGPASARSRRPAPPGYPAAPGTTPPLAAPALRDRPNCADSAHRTPPPVPPARHAPSPPAPPAALAAVPSEPCPPLRPECCGEPSAYGRGGLFTSLPRPEFQQYVAHYPSPRWVLDARETTDRPRWSRPRWVPGYTLALALVTS